jgi:short-subunit dehydrogenase
LTWALVTGACSGIGLEIAHELARHGYALVLVSERPPAIDLAARSIADAYEVATHAITMDLAQPEAAGLVYGEVGRLGLQVEILVSNAGVLMFGEVVDSDPDRVNALLQLHVTTPTLLARYFGCDMRAQGHGHILFVSSASAWRDFPGIALYGSTKRYLRSFATALREELRPWGVNVTCVAPGAVATGLYGCSNSAALKAAKLGLLKDPASVARASVRGMLQGKALVLPGLGAKAMAAGAALTPRWLVHLLRTRTRLLSRPR